MRLLLITPPFTQINTPYPATAYLTGYLRGQGYDVVQSDMGLAVALKMFSATGLASVFAQAQQKNLQLSEDEAEVLSFFTSAESEYLNSIDAVIRFLQGKDDASALRIAARNWLPEGPRFSHLAEHPEILDSFGELGVRDRAKYLASLYIDDLADLIRMVADPDFQLSKYGEQLAASECSFQPLLNRLETTSPSLIDQFISEETRDLNQKFSPDVVGLTCPFPGNVYGALKIAQVFKQLNLNIKIILGGGFVNTELRELSDPRLFDLVDYVTFDDGESPLELLLQHFQGQRDQNDLLRVKFRFENKVVQSDGLAKDPSPFKDRPAPVYEGLELNNYISMMEMPNPMHRMWSDFRWNKLTLAHGCYWKKCTFCDVNLDYISRYEPARVEDLVENMKKIKEQTGISGFHFVDEAAPPAILKALSVQLKTLKTPFTWWGNLRFDKQFTPELAELMAEAGCVAVTGGIEVASPRLLELINKGVSLQQVARVTKAFSEHGIFVHGYLMYGYPSQTDQETVDSLEVVRQLFAFGCLHSAHWHRFVATVHSPIGKNPQQFGIEIRPKPDPEGGVFARNIVEFHDPTPAHHDRLGQGLRRAVYNYMHGVGIEDPVENWFDFRVPKSKVSKDLVQGALISN